MPNAYLDVNLVVLYRDQNIAKQDRIILNNHRYMLLNKNSKMDGI